jgi:hypothetical protein
MTSGLVAQSADRAHAEVVGRRLAAGAFIVGVLLVGPAGSSLTAAHAGTVGETGVPVVHLEMRCHTVGDHTPIG